VDEARSWPWGEPEPPVELTDGPTRVRTYRDDDVEPMLEAVSESIPEIQPWLPWCHPGYGRTESERWVRSRLAAWRRFEELSFVIVDEASGRFIGSCGLNQLNPNFRMANLGYWIRTGSRGLGHTARATRLVARYGFEAVGLQRIEIVADVDNRASQRVAEKAGATREGRLRRRLFAHGRSSDAFLYSLVREDLA
jgi:RimJ/RimL family protein N-acetyltransferase